MGLIRRLLGEDRAARTAECASPPEMRREDVLLLLREIQARLAETIATVDAAQARLRELSRRYPYTS